MSILKSREWVIISKQQLIIEKAVALYAQDGMASTSIQDITDACGISKGAFYLSFKSKDELLVAIFEHFLREIIGQFNCLLEKEMPVKEKLAHYFLLHFQLFEEKLPFISMFMKEQMNPINEQILNKFNYYNELSDKTTLALLKEVYGERIEPFQYDLLTTIKGILKGYSEFIVFHRQPYDFIHLSSTLIEKTDILVEYTTKTFLTEQLWQSKPRSMQEYSVTTFEVQEEVKRWQEVYKGHPIIEDTLSLIQDELQLAKPRPALLHGMMANLKQQDNLQWLALLLKQFTVQL
ncbi:TetR/AcrR family transcriptional regulator [Viridibacillus sp. YIM B01967]|uniref:TetR/AcrR family transcriptional regulator n=1 Tax=Viridibacillus soli TaxID=2798301 RepID=A0ABS1H7M1_9BACL|nr:TetR/AcrR family transcriptional regulator [Viridibacillus soli]MBK3495406.1 TetR/AcrR family transcriptional regulator [Viridibacillus soli]